MPQLALLLEALMAGLVSFIAQFFTKKVAVLTAGVLALSTITVALVVTFNTIVTPLAQQLFNHEVGQFVGLAFPPIAGSCMAAMSATWAACTLYGWQYRALSLSVQA